MAFAIILEQHYEEKFNIIFVGICLSLVWTKESFREIHSLDSEFTFKQIVIF